MAFVSNRFALLLLAALTGFAAGAHAQETSSADAVFIRGVAPLDEPRGLCLDIPGHRDRVDVTRDLVVHTCKRDIWNLDERFSESALRGGTLHMPAYDLCVSAGVGRSGGRVGLADCDGLAVQAWIFSAGRLTPRQSPDLCLTIGPEPSELTPGGRRLPSRYVARSLGLAPCSDAAAERQRWMLEKPDG